MARFFVKWHTVNARLPPTPREGALERQDKLQKLQTAMQQPGSPIKDWGCFGNGKDGYLILDGVNEDQVLATLLPFMPDVEFDEFAVLTVGQVLTAINTALPAMP
jgi:hypothetical protein